MGETFRDIELVANSIQPNLPNLSERFDQGHTSCHTPFPRRSSAVYCILQYSSIFKLCQKDTRMMNDDGACQTVRNQGQFIHLNFTDDTTDPSALGCARGFTY